MAKKTLNFILARRLTGLIALLLGPVCLVASPAPSHASPEQSAAAPQGAEPARVLDFGAALVAYEDYPFPAVPDGELWVPDLGWNEVTAFIPDSVPEDYPQAAQGLLAQANSLIEQNDGAGAIALLLRDPAAVPYGQAEVTIAEIYFHGKGGVTKDEAAGLDWLARAARFNPYFYANLGIRSPDQQTKLHLWSLGLSRGCLDCASRLVNATITRPKTREERRLWGKSPPDITVDAVPQELRLAYALVAIDIGDDDGPGLLREVLQDHYIHGERWNLPEWATQLIAGIRADALAAVGGNVYVSTYPVLASVVYDKLRTGLVPGRLEKVDQLLAEGNLDLAARRLVFTSASGRHLPALINTLVERAPSDRSVLGVTALNTLALRATEWGDPTHAAASALIWDKGYSTFYVSGGSWKTRNVQNSTPTEYFTALAQSSGLMPREVAAALSADNVIVSATEAAAEARTCLIDARNSPSRTLLTWLNCRSATHRAWSATDELDFGVLDDQGFEALLRAASEEYQAEYDRRVSGGADEMTRFMAELAAPRRDFSNTRVTATGALQRQNEAFARADSGNFRNMPNHYKQVEDWYRAFRNQRSRIASGAASDLRETQGVSAGPSTCAFWSLREMPFCK